MASYVARTRIKTLGTDGEEEFIEPGDTVTGLSNQAMKGLWEAGALEEKSSDEPQEGVDTGPQPAESVGDASATPSGANATPSKADSSKGSTPSDAGTSGASSGTSAKEKTSNPASKSK
jgi:hypothetical protein